MSRNSECLGELSVTQNLQLIKRGSHETLFDQDLRCNLGTRLKRLVQLTDVDHSHVGSKLLIVKSTLGDTSEQRHLATLKTAATR